MAKVEWFGTPGHFICAKDCRFHMCTAVNGYLISTVGEMWGERAIREIYARVHDPAWLAKNAHLKGDYFDAAYMQRFGYQTIGCDRTYETMVFKAGKRCTVKDCNCGLPEINGSELDFAAYNHRGEATRGHRKMVAKYARKRAVRTKGKGVGNG